MLHYDSDFDLIAKVTGQRCEWVVPCRNRRLKRLATAERTWEEYWAAIRPVELSPAVERHAGQLARTYACRGADAVHLASALAIGDPELVFAVWDRRLHASANAARLRVAPSELAS